MSSMKVVIKLNTNMNSVRHIKTTVVAGLMGMLISHTAWSQNSTSTSTGRILSRVSQSK